MAIPTNKVGILVVEIDSGGALRSAGDRVIVGSRTSKSEQEWVIRQKIAACTNDITEAVHKHRGIVARRSAEVVFATFPNAEGTFKAACEIQLNHQEDVRTMAETTNTATLGLRLGLTFGKMVVDAGRVTGDAVEVASQLAGRANPGQVVAAESVINALGDEVRNAVKSLGTSTFSDVSGEIEVFEVQWDRKKAAQAAYAKTVAAMQAPTPEPKLEISSRGKQIVLGNEHPSVTLRSGKQREPHAKLEFRDEKFYLVNLRANGTRVRAANGQEELCLDEVELMQEGAISLSDEFKEGSSDLLLYRRIS